jgi:uncharacterized membrane protein YgcG
VSAARPSEPVGTKGETFFTREITVTTPDGNVTVAGSSDGASSFWVDDILELDVTHADGTTSTYRADDSDGCTASTVLNTKPTSLASYFKPGINTVHVTFSDACGGNDENSAVYLVGNASFTSGGSKTMTTSSYTVVRYLQQISVPSCIANLLGAKIAAAGALCAFLAGSANSFPPSTLAGKSLTDFIAGKQYRQYRQYVHYPAYDVTCAGNTIQGISPSGSSVPFSWGLGYTRAKGPHGTNYFSLAEPYLQDNNYIWTDLIENISCDQTFGLTVGTSNVPTTDIYINGHEVSYDQQSSDLGQFLKTGGGTLHPVGYGNLDHPCHVKYFNTAGQLADSFTGCASTTGIGGFGGGSSGGGGASGSW